MTPRADGRWRRIGWFILLWLAGVIAIAMLAWLLRALMGTPG